MSDYIIFHNPRCSKSRQTLALLEAEGIEPTIVKYLENPPTNTELTEILVKLKKKPSEILRKGEAIYKELGLASASLTDDALVATMIEHPKLIERPIVVCGDRAVLGRPPENVKELF